MKNKKYPKIDGFYKYKDKIEEDWINNLALHNQVVVNQIQ